MNDPQLAAELIVRCREAATAAHIAHLTTTSFSQHVALARFYDEIVERVDEFAESYIGRHGLIMDYPDVEGTEQLRAGIAIVDDLRTWTDLNRAEISDASELQNLIDEIVSLCNSTLYKLRILS